MSKSQKKPLATEASVASAPQLARHINDLANNAEAMGKSLLAIPITAGKIAKAQAMTAGTTVYIAHGLGRAYTGYLVTRRSSAGLLIEEALKTGQTSDKYIALQTSVTGTFDVLVF